MRPSGLMSTCTGCLNSPGPEPALPTVRTYSPSRSKTRSSEACMSRTQMRPRLSTSNDATSPKVSGPSPSRVPILISSTTCHSAPSGQIPRSPFLTTTRPSASVSICPSQVAPLVSPGAPQATARAARNPRPPNLMMAVSRDVVAPADRAEAHHGEPFIMTPVSCAVVACESGDDDMLRTTRV